MTNLLPLLAVLTLSLQHGEALRCYVCSSLRDANCRDPYNSQTSSYHDHRMTECSQESMRNIHDSIPGIFSHFSYNSMQHEDFRCVKAVTREHEREVVVRSCTIPRTDTFDVCSQLKSRDLSFCETCSHDGCNGAAALSPLTAAALAGALLMTLLASRY